MKEIVSVVMRGRLTDFTDSDIFIDNGKGVQCVSKMGKYISCGQYSPLKLTKTAVKEIDSVCERIVLPNDYCDFIISFKLRLRKTT